VKLIQEPIEQRSFAEWTMGLGQPDRDELGAIPGLNDFFRQGSMSMGISLAPSLRAPGGDAPARESAF
jgi:hypothetical protein